MQPQDLDPKISKLAFLLGKWRYSQTYEKSPGMPDGGESNGTYDAVPGPGGQSILTDFTDSGSAYGNISGHEVFTWEPEPNAYVGYAFASTSPGCFMRTGHWEGETLVFLREMNLPQGQVRMRYVYTDVHPDHLTIQTSVAKGDGPFSLAFTTRARKE